MSCPRSPRSRVLSSKGTQWVWAGALSLFILAGTTGAFFRFGVLYGWTGGLALENIRHAHSHLMYFGWGTPLLIGLIWHALPAGATAPYRRLFRWLVGSTFGAALLAFLPFLLHGYSLVSVGGAKVPIAAMAAGVNIFCWYGFAGVYVRSTADLPRTVPLRIWDVAVAFLLVSTLGAWSLPLAGPLGLETALGTSALIHFFLDLFSEGWFVLAVIGVAYAHLGNSDKPKPLWPVYLIALGSPVIFLLALPRAELPTAAELLGRAGGVAVGVGSLAVTVYLGRILLETNDSWIWGVPLGCLALKALAQLGGSLAADLWLGSRHGLRILYLHLTLLGFLSTGLVAGASRTWSHLKPKDIGYFYAAIGVVIGSLVPLTSLIPSGANMYTLAAWAALLPIIAGVWLLFRSEETGPSNPADMHIRNLGANPVKQKN